MKSNMTRKIVKIDQAKCNGCGLCVPKCAEGAIEIVEGKARLASENLCDGLGACLGHCPQGAIIIEERLAEEFDEHAVRERKEESHAKPQADNKIARQADSKSPEPQAASTAGHAGCPARG